MKDRFEYENEMYDNDFPKHIISLPFVRENRLTEANNCFHSSNGFLSFNRLQLSSIMPLTTTTITKIC